MSNLAKLNIIYPSGLCDYGLYDDKSFMCYLKNNVTPPDHCTEDQLSDLIDWDELTQLLTFVSTYCCTVPCSSIAEYRKLYSEKSEKIWKTSGAPGFNSDSEIDSDYD